MITQTPAVVRKGRIGQMAADGKGSGRLREDYFQDLGRRCWKLTTISIINYF